MIPPLFIYVRIGPVPLPVPALLLWPLLAALLLGAAITLPLVRVRGTTVSQRARLPFILYRMLAATRGLSIRVDPARGPAVRVCCW